ncbi:lipid II:glycine glycyltransferase FemX [Halovivax gelatinilyticus]|uniref:lipid II:glycine glycyltransferase FemX n=1 Tax=Halovivax gelatinilyticus TaxID=2961597 RepID=UPI0020CA588E|nr:GNAT family N-acetyltransferase [Halovivax gelatinilyticus]
MVSVRVATDDDLDRWNRIVGRSPQGTLFHEYEALCVLAEHAGARLHPLIGYKGQEPVGLFPVFSLRKGPITTAFSPPPHLRVPSLGPAYCNLEKLKQRKREKRRERFAEGCFEWIDDELSPKYVHVRTATGFADARSFTWSGYDVTPEYTYHVDVTPEPETLLSRFSSDARRNVTNTPEDAYEIDEGDRDAIDAIVEQVAARYAAQNVSFDVPADFVVDLYDRIEGGYVRPYVCRVDGEFVGGILAIEFGDTIGRWMGGVRTDRDVDVPVNDLLDWTIMRDAHERGLSTYDLVGADNQRINRYKSKFNPDLAEYYAIERGSWGMQTLAHLYNTVK